MGVTVFVQQAVYFVLLFVYCRVQVYVNSFLFVMFTVYCVFILQTASLCCSPHQ